MKIIELKKMKNFRWSVKSSGTVLFDDFRNVRSADAAAADTAAAAIDAAAAGAQNAAVVPAASVPLRHSWLRRKEGRPRRRRREGRCPR